MKRGVQHGFSLVEVILALGLLAAVLVSIASLFIFGGTLLNAGKSHTEALAVGRSILEEMSGWSFEQLYQRFGLDGSQTAYVIDTQTNAFATKWQSQLDENVRDGLATVEITSVAAGSPPALASAEAIRIVVTVSWQEGRRARRLRLATVRM